MSIEKNLGPKAPDSASSFNFKYQREVKTHEIDIQQVVHNVVYFYYFEEARIEYLKRLGFPIKNEIVIDNVEFVIAHNEADYHESARLGDVLTIFARISKVGRASFTFELEAIRQDGAQICSGHTTVVAVGKGPGRPTPLPDRIRKAIEQFEGAVINAASD